MTHPTTSRSGEMRRHRLISESLSHKLSGMELLHALQICDEELETDEDFSAAKFCQRLTTELPGTQLGKKTRLLVLHNVREPVPSPPAETMPTRSFTLPAEPASPPTSKSMTISAERRKTRRKVTRLAGDYATQKLGRLGSIVVENLSETGARLQLHTPKTLKRGEPLVVRFVLDDKHRSSIHLRARVKWSVYDTVGIEFIPTKGLPQVLIDYIYS